MSDGPRNDKGELMELGHDAVPGYRKIFYVIFVLGLSYLFFVFAFGDSFMGGH
jgi:hypothetical protein